MIFQDEADNTTEMGDGHDDEWNVSNTTLSSLSVYRLKKTFEFWFSGIYNTF